LDAIRFSVGVFGASIDALSSLVFALASVAADVAFFAFFAFFAARRRARASRRAARVDASQSPRVVSTKFVGSSWFERRRETHLGEGFEGRGDIVERAVEGGDIHASRARRARGPTRRSLWLRLAVAPKRQNGFSLQ